MKSELVKIDDDHQLIIWSDDCQCGQIDFRWYSSIGKFVVDSEHLGVETMIKIIKSADINNDELCSK